MFVCLFLFAKRREGSNTDQIHDNFLFDFIMIILACLCIFIMINTRIFHQFFFCWKDKEFDHYLWKGAFGDFHLKGIECTNKRWTWKYCYWFAIAASLISWNLDKCDACWNIVVADKICIRNGTIDGKFWKIMHLEYKHLLET